MSTYDLINKIRLLEPHANIDKLYGTYNSIAEALLVVVPGIRMIGRTVGVIENGSIVEYWFKEGIEDADLIAKSGDSSNKIISLGAITTTSDNVHLALPISGVNSVRINNNLLSKGIPDDFPFTPVTTGAKILIIYAINDTDIFHLAEGVESSEAVEPTIPEGALFVARIIVDITGEIIDDNPIKASEIFNDSLASGINVADALTDLHLDNDGLREDTNIALGLKLDKPTTDGTFAVKKAGTDYSYVPVSGDNIANANLTWAIDRTQDLGTKKLTFTNGRFSVPTLEMEITSSNSVPNKIWTDGVDLWVTNNAGINSKIVSDSVQKNKQFLVALPATVSEDWKGCIVIFTSTGTLTIPNNLSSDFTFNGKVDFDVVLTPVITSPMGWFETAPFDIIGVQIFTLLRRIGSNKFEILGI